MRIYKNPFVKRPYYFVVTGAARTGVSSGYAVDFYDEKWVITKSNFYSRDLGEKLPVVAENNISIQSVINRAILDAVLDAVGERKDDG